MLDGSFREVAGLVRSVVKMSLVDNSVIAKDSTAHGISNEGRGSGMQVISRIESSSIVTKFT